MLALMHPRGLLALLAVRVNCWLMLNPTSARTPTSLSRAASQPFVPQSVDKDRVVPSKMQNLALALAKIHAVGDCSALNSPLQSLSTTFRKLQAVHCGYRVLLSRCSVSTDLHLDTYLHYWKYKQTRIIPQWNSDENSHLSQRTAQRREINNSGSREPTYHSTETLEK